MEHPTKPFGDALGVIDLGEGSSAAPISSFPVCDGATRHLRDGHHALTS